VALLDGPAVEEKAAVVRALDEEAVAVAHVEVVDG
jgi:hypothetical protein